MTGTVADPHRANTSLQTYYSHDKQFVSETTAQLQQLLSGGGAERGTASARGRLERPGSTDSGFGGIARASTAEGDAGSDEELSR